MYLLKFQTDRSVPAVSVLRNVYSPHAILWSSWAQKYTVLIGRNRLASRTQIECGVLVAFVEYRQPSIFLQMVWPVYLRWARIIHAVRFKALIGHELWRQYCLKPALERRDRPYHQRPRTALNYDPFFSTPPSSTFCSSSGAGDGGILKTLRSFADQPS